MITNRCFQFQIFPTPEQEQQFLQFAGCRRGVWNWGLERKRSTYKKTGKSIGYNILAFELVMLKKQEKRFYLKDCHSQVLQQALMDLEKSYQAYFKSATIKQDHRGFWFVIFVAHLSCPEPKNTFENPVGLDAGLTHFLIDSNGNKTENPRFYRKGHKKLKKAGQRLSRRRKGSKNRAKAKRLLARTHARIRNQRQDFLHKLSNKICKAHEVICIEDLNIKGLVRTKRKGLSKSFHDAAHSQFRFYLEYKARREGGIAIRIDRWFPSSKLCFSCGWRNVHLTESERFWTCVGCGIIHDRDINAAKNILVEGLRLLAEGNSESLNACGEAVSPDASQAVLVESGTS